MSLIITVVIKLYRINYLYCESCCFKMWYSTIWRRVAMRKDT